VTRKRVVRIWSFLVIILFYVVASWNGLRCAYQASAGPSTTIPASAATSVVARRNGATAHCYDTIRRLLSLRLRLRSLLPNSRTPEPDLATRREFTYYIFYNTSHNVCGYVDLCMGREERHRNEACIATTLSSRDIGGIINSTTSRLPATLRFCL